jgi:hypothetical protein
MISAFLVRLRGMRFDVVIQAYLEQPATGTDAGRGLLLSALVEGFFHWIGHVHIDIESPVRRDAAIEKEVESEYRQHDNNYNRN